MTCVNELLSSNITGIKCFIENRSHYVTQINSMLNSCSRSVLLVYVCLAETYWPLFLPVFSLPWMPVWPGGIHWNVVLMPWYDAKMIMASNMLVIAVFTSWDWRAESYRQDSLGVLIVVLSTDEWQLVWLLHSCCSITQSAESCIM